MANLPCRSARRLITCLRSTAALRPRTPTPTPRTITSFQGLQGMVQPWKATRFEAHEEEEEEMEGMMEQRMSVHVQALHEWQEVARQMREMRIVPDALAGKQAILSSAEQVQDLMQALLEEDLLDIRRGWVATTNY